MLPMFLLRLENQAKTALFRAATRARVYFASLRRRAGLGD